MHHLMRPAALAATTGMLLACGGGGGGGSTPPPPPPAAPTSYARPVPVAGGAATFAVSEVRNDNSTASSSYTETTATVNMDGSYVVQRTVAGILNRTINNTATGARASQTLANGNVCSYTPARLYFDFPLSVGKTWSSTWAYQCALGYRENAALTARVVRVESVSVPAGTFDALRVEATLNFTASNDGNLVGGAMGNAQYRIDSVCWWQTAPVQFLGCEDTYSYVGAAPANYLRTTSYKRM